MKSRFSVLAFAALAALALVAPVARAADTYTTVVSATNTNTKVTFASKPGRVVVINNGSNPAFVNDSGTASASDTTSVRVDPGEGLDCMYPSGYGPASLGVITSSSTATVRVNGYLSVGQGGTAIAFGCAHFPISSTAPGASPSFTNLTVTGTEAVTGVATFTAQPIFSSLTASRIALTDASKGIVSNGAITSNAVPKSVSSGASLAASALSDDGTNLIGTEPYQAAGANGGTATCGWGASENLTLSTGGTTTDTAGNLLPANSLILAVVGRVTTTITAACTGWELGDATSVARFTANDTTLTANETQVGLKQLQGGVSTDALGPIQTSAAKVRVTCAGGNPGAGVVRIQVYSCTFVAPTS